MIEPYRMVVINSILLGLVSIGFLVYLLMAEKRKIRVRYLPLLILISLLPLISILRKGTYESGSLSDYVKFSYSFYESLRDGNIIPRWDAFRCGGYGCPQFEYMYTLPYYIVSIFHAFGLSFITSLKLLLASSFVASGLGMYVFVKKDFGEKVAFIAGIFYLFAPYHLSDLHFSSDIGEMLALAMLPFVFYFFRNAVEEAQEKWIVFSGVSFSFLILSHHVIAMCSLPILAAYIAFTLRNKKAKLKPYLHFALSLLLGILLTAFYWMPIALESKYIFWGKYGALSFIHDIRLFFYSPWKYGLLFQGPNGELSFLLGYLHWLVVLAAVVWLFVKKNKDKDKKIILFLLIGIGTLFLLTQPISKAVWEFTPIVQKFQFSYRLLIPLAFLSSLLAGIFLRKYNKKIIFLVCFLTVATTILNWGNRRTIPEINDEYLIHELKTKEPVFQATIPNSAQYRRITRANDHKSPASIIRGNGRIHTLSRSTTSHEFLVDAKSDIVIRENIFFYPGWSIIIDKAQLTKKNIDIVDKATGLIIFPLTKGLHHVEITFFSTQVRKVADITSLLTVLAVSLFALKKSIRLRWRKH